MKEINPLKFSKNLLDTYKRYLFSVVPIGDAKLRDLFWKALDNRNFEIFKGPYVYCPPQYKEAQAPRQLMKNNKPPLLDNRLVNCDKEYFNLDRRLYTHQADALKHIQEGKNTIISTGTGSGKTECFLLPLLNDALQHPSSGVRAVIIYPMNALANDQLDRMRGLLKSVPEITFGRYTGETPYDADQAKKQNPDFNWQPNERYTREEIRKNPPHILLTNFAMLEYLLLRPIDSAIFSQKSVQYIVLDEAHTYTGAKGIDISMLLRRFSSLFPKNKIQFILTSATISENKKDISQFASKLCGVDFDDESIILGDEKTLLEPDAKYSVDKSYYEKVLSSDSIFDEWCNSLDDELKLFDLINNSSIFKNDIKKDKPSNMLFNVFKTNPLLYKIKKLCKEKPLTVNELAQSIFNSVTDETKRIITWLLVIGAYARDENNTPPLLPIKFHHFMRGLSGVYICVNSKCNAEDKHPTQSKWKALFLEERETCDYCKSNVLPLSSCIHCGLPVFKVYVKDGKWQAIKPGEINPETYLLTFSFLNDDTEELETAPDEIRQLCLKCGGFEEGNELFDCCNNPLVIELVALRSNENGDTKKCPQCAGTSRFFDTVFRGFVTGDDAATSVIAETILRELPGAEYDKPAGGRSLIAFSDSRQRAAFFAPHLSRTTLETAFLQPLTNAIKKTEQQNDGHPDLIEEIANNYVAAVSQKPFFVMKRLDDETGIESYDISSRKDLTRTIKNKLKRDVIFELFRQICRSQRYRNSLTGLAIAYSYIEFNDYEKENIVENVPQLFRGENESDSFSLIQVLLQIFLRRKAIDFPEWITPDMISESRLSARFHRSRSGKINNRNVYRWNPFAAEPRHRQNASSRSVPLKILKKVFPGKEHDEKFYDELLGRIWDILIDSVLTDLGTGEYQLNHERILIGTKTHWNKCNTCGIIAPFNVANKCSLPDCNGRVSLLDDSGIEESFQNNHSFERFKREPMPIRVKEHTAQLTNETGRTYQTEFKNRDINVLSTSTTFELGIDVGQLKSVFLRNIPPSTSSYIQRVGRAGRRLEGSSFVVTFSRNVPHDQYFFNNTIKIMSGRIIAPIINLKNDKLVQRHVNSFLIGKFLGRHFSNVSNRSLTLEWFFLLPDNTSSPYVKFIQWTEKNHQDLLTQVKYILPYESPLMNKDAVNKSVEQITDFKSKYIDDELDRYQSQLKELSDKLLKATGSTRTGISKAMDIIEKLEKQFRNQTLIDFLSTISWLPSYAFPQDIVKLRVMQDRYSDKMRLERDREYGIAEYAPGAEIIADGKLFKSKGLVFYGKVPEVKKYRYCEQCRRLYIQSQFEGEINCDSCGGRLRGRDGGDYIEPLGFTTSIGDSVREPDITRQLPPPNTDVFLLEGAPEDSFQKQAVLKSVSYGFYQDGKLFKANRGFKRAGFRICLRCGIGFDNNDQTRVHKTPWGSKCEGQSRHMHLAHQFTTEILQLRFLSAPERWDISFWLSLAEAIRNAVAETLEIDRRDIGATFRGIEETSGRGEIVLYDRVPGSAGYLKEVIDRLPKVLENVLLMLKNCPCDIESSCYICLRSYENQFYWEHLKRRPIVEWIEKII